MGGQEGGPYMLNRDELDSLEKITDKVTGTWFLAQVLKKMPDCLSCLVVALILGFVLLFAGIIVVGETFYR